MCVQTEHTCQYAQIVQARFMISSRIVRYFVYACTKLEHTVEHIMYGYQMGICLLKPIADIADVKIPTKCIQLKA